MVLNFFLEPGRYPADMPAEYQHIQFWTNFLHNSVFFMGIGFAATFFIATHTLAWGGWFVAFKRIPEAIMTFLPIGAIFLLIMWLSTKMHWHGIYLWNDHHAQMTDELVKHKAPLVNIINYGLVIAVVLLWFGFAYTFRKLSLEEDVTGYAKNYAKKIVVSALFLPIAGFSSVFVILLLLMSIDIHWYSTMYYWYNGVSWWVSFVTFMTLLLLYLKTQGYLPNVNKEHFHDLGKYVFGFSVFWTYLWFSQFMLIWYSNNGEETIYFHTRMEKFPFVFFGNILLNFVLPFAILIMNSSKRSFGTLGLACTIVFLGHWNDFFQEIKPGVWYNVEHAYHEMHAGHGDAHGDAVKPSSTIDLDGAKVVLSQHTEGHVNEAPAGHGADAHATDAHAADAHAAHGDAAHGAHGHDAGLGSFYLGIHFPGLLEFGTFVGFLGLFMFWVFMMLSKAPLNATNDAYHEESNHHMTGVHDSFTAGGH